VGEQDRDGIAALDAALRQRRRKLARACVELGVATSQRSMNDGDVVGKHGGRPLQEGERRERLEVRGGAGEIDVGGRHYDLTRLAYERQVLRSIRDRVAGAAPQRIATAGGSGISFSAITARRRFG